MKFPGTMIVLIVLIIGSPVSTRAQSSHECHGHTSCFGPDLPLKPGDKFNWDITGINISEQISTFEWNVYELTHVEVEILEEIRGLSISIERNFDKYFLYTNSIINTETNERSTRTGLFEGGIPAGLILYNARLDENEELINIFEWEVEQDFGHNYTTQENWMNNTYHEYQYGNSTIEEGVFTKSSYSYQFSHPENDSSIILSTREVFDETRIEIDTGLLIYDNRTRQSFTIFEGNTTSQRAVILEQDQDDYIEINLGNPKTVIIVASVSSIIVLSIIVVLLIRRKSN